MTAGRVNPKRVLALDPTSRGFGYAVLESPTTPVDWGGKVTRGDKQAASLSKVSELIRHYRPEVIVLEDFRRSRRCQRVKDLLSGVCELAAKEGLRTRCFTTSYVKRVFQTFGARTKHEISQAVAQQLPELAPQVPRYRKPWMSEDYQMAMFDAVALALTYFYSRPVRGGKTLKPLLP
jgi:Holliday junction resolvasome RuvABC endonuclease subunit